MKWQRSAFIPALFWAVVLLIGLASPLHPQDAGFPRTIAGAQFAQNASSQSLPSALWNPRLTASVNCAATPCMALTFDDGPDTKVTPHLLDTLTAKGVVATFFVVGTNAAAHPDLINRMYREGHEIGNHSWSHVNLTTISPAQIEDQVALTQTAVMAAGVPAPRWFRPPYGAVNAVVRAHVPLSLGFWNIDPEDWNKKDPNAIVEVVKAKAGPGRVVDLHDLHPTTVDALPAIIDALKPHYHLVTMTQLFDAVPGERAEYYGR